MVDPWITCHAYQSWALWLVGRTAQARELSDRAMALSKELQHPFTRTLTFCFDAWLCQWEGDVGAVRERAKDALAVAREQGFEFWIGWGEMMLGWADAARRQRRRDRDDAARPGRLARARVRARHDVLPLADGRGVRDAGRLDEAGPRSTPPTRPRSARARAGGRPRSGACAAISCGVAARLDAVERELAAALQLARGRSARSLELRAEAA